MIKTFLKHHIYEKCIEVFFDGITKAFNRPPIDDGIIFFIKPWGNERRVWNIDINMKLPPKANRYADADLEYYKKKLYTAMSVPEKRIKELSD